MAIVNVDVKDLENNPHCVHGPTLKYSRQVDGKIVSFFACSAYRDRKDCPFYLLEDEVLTDSKRLRWYEMKLKLLEKYDRIRLNDYLNRILELAVNKRRYCEDCSLLFSARDINEHKNHNLYNGVLSNAVVGCPTKILSPVQKDKKEAQYWFTEKSVNMISYFLSKLEVKGVLCIGCPTIHEKCCKENLKSILMDLDPRYHSFYSSDEFTWFNMFNFHFMNDEEDGLNVINRIFDGGSTAVVIDPPFGARLEGLSYTLKKLLDLSKFNSAGLIFLLVLPYFMEPKVKEMGLNLNKLDFSIEYNNHRFKKNKTPVRLFTNVDQSLFPVDKSRSCKFCSKCSKVCRFDSVHCSICNFCHGTKFKRCHLCSKCVKPLYFHCKKCNFCVNQNHICNPEMIINNDFKSKKRKLNKIN